MARSSGWKSKGSVDLDNLDVQGSREAPLPITVSKSFQQQRGISGMPSIFTEDAEAVHELRTAIINGADFNRLVETRPDGALTALRNLAVKKIGTFESRDIYVYRAFKNSHLITRGLDSPDDPHYVQNWQNMIKTEAKSHLMEEGSLYETVRLTAYSVNIYDAAAPLEKGVLRSLLTSERQGAEVDEIWDLPAVLAVIEYKWDYWARKYLVIEFLLYLGWILSFVAYLMIYIEYEKLTRVYDWHKANRVFVVVLAFFFDGLSIVFMLPFLLIEYNSIVYYKFRWLQMWNVIDACAYVLQGIISVDHFLHYQLGATAYSTLLAIQCTILFIKVQYFLRVMGVGASYIETLRILLYDVRYFLSFIVLMTASATLSLAVLYKEENDNKSDIEDWNESLEDFASVPKSLVTTYAILLGNFESSYVSDTKNKVVKGIFFLLFQLFMAITILNLLIAVMTDSYANIMKIKRRLYNRGKAQLIDELEITLPNFLLGTLKPYVHFAVVEKAEAESEELIQKTSIPSQDAHMQDLRTKLQNLEKLVESLHTKMDAMQQGQLESVVGKAAS